MHECIHTLQSHGFLCVNMYKSHRKQKSAAFISPRCCRMLHLIIVTQRPQMRTYEPGHYISHKQSDRATYYYRSSERDSHVTCRVVTTDRFESGGSVAVYKTWDLCGRL